MWFTSYSSTGKKLSNLNQVNYGMNSLLNWKQLWSPNTFKYQIKSHLINKLNFVTKQQIRSVELGVCPVQCNFFIFDHVTFIQFKICCCVQNFIEIGDNRFFDFQNGGRPPSWNCYYRTLLETRMCSAPSHGFRQRIKIKRGNDVPRENYSVWDFGHCGGLRSLSALGLFLSALSKMSWFVALPGNVSASFAPSHFEANSEETLVRRKQWSTRALHRARSEVKQLGEQSLCDPVFCD